MFSLGGRCPPLTRMGLRRPTPTSGDTDLPSLRPECARPIRFECYSYPVGGSATSPMSTSLTQLVAPRASRSRDGATSSQFATARITAALACPPVTGSWTQT